MFFHLTLTSLRFDVLINRRIVPKRSYFSHRVLTYRQDHAKKICLSNATSRHCKIFRNKIARAKMRRRGEILETKTTVVDDRRAFVRLSAGNKLI